MARSHVVPPGRVPASRPWLVLPFLVALVVALASLARVVARFRPARRRALACAALLLVVAIGCGGGSSSAPPAATTASPTVTPTALTFGTQVVQSTSASQAVTLSNAGPATLSISGITTSGDFSQTNTCNGSVVAGSSCAINVSFTPAAAGARTGTLTISDNTSGGSQMVSLTGTGQAKGTPAGNYSINVIGAFGTFTSAPTVTINVQ
jgi:hypothetical protein